MQEEQKITVLISDIRVFVAYAAIDVLIAVGMFAVAPKGLGQVMGVAFALMLLPLPPTRALLHALAKSSTPQTSLTKWSRRRRPVPLRCDHSLPHRLPFLIRRLPRF